MLIFNCRIVLTLTCIKIVYQIVIAPTPMIWRVARGSICASLPAQCARGSQLGIVCSYPNWNLRQLTFAPPPPLALSIVSLIISTIHWKLVKYLLCMLGHEVILDIRRIYGSLCWDFLFFLDPWFGSYLKQKPGNQFPCF